MARKQPDQFMVTARYTIGWTNPGNNIASGFGLDDEAQALAKADELVTEMRAAGAASPIREVTVVRWERGSSLRDSPTIFKGSYFDPEQGLTEAEELAARIHGFHATADRINARYAYSERHGRTENIRMGYREWPEGFGDKPDNCPACGESLHLDCGYYDNLPRKGRHTLDSLTTDPA